jgi:hypothetical protein
MDAGLAGEPVDTVFVEHGGVEVGVGLLFGQAEQRHLVITGVDARDRVLAPLGHPGRSVRADDDTMGRGALAEVDQLVGAVTGIETAQRAVALAAEPDRAIGGGGGVARAHACRDRIIFDAERAFLGAGVAQQGGRGEDPDGGGSKKLAAIHCVTSSYQCEGLDADINL